MPADHTEQLRNIKSFPQLVKYLREELEWEINSDNFEEITFDYEPEELGLDAKAAAKVKYIKRLRPVYTNQPWSIFFVNFEPKRLPLVVLRRILNALVVRKRASANKVERPAWEMGDLLFISSYGDKDHRDISFAHFVQAEEPGDLPTLKVLGWDDEDTTLRLRDVQTRLREYMRWPDDPSDAESWRERWAKAFVLTHREVIRTSRDLAVQMAKLARRIRKRALAVLEVESDKGPLRKMTTAFKEALIHDLDDDGFADMYAQTITYGLLTARVSRWSGGLVTENVVDMVPVTNPFLREMLQMFMSASGRTSKMDFDELGINEVVHALRDANIEQVLKDFGDRNPQEDPVIHFYELFLKEYDSDIRMKRGVFYTPRPVVSYIVRSVHELLQTEFGLEDGLADTTTWGEMAKRHKDLKIPEGVDLKSPFVNILDPATGTATFLVEVIDLIHKTMKAKWKKQGQMALEVPKLWNEYVPKHLLPRVHGYELLMAPYAVAHMKIGLKLYETGYRFKSDERARIFLTNALEPGTDKALEGRLSDWAPALAHEAAAVNNVKRHTRFTVVIGNPPYSGISSNMTDYAQRLVDAYKFVDGGALNERKLWLQDDYVKFIRKAQTTIDHTGTGVFGYITNHGYLDNPTFRGMRQSLMGTFPQLRVLDLHGNANKKEQSPDGSEDKNVFDIRQGVAICLATRANRTRSVEHGDLWGTRGVKYAWLTMHSICDTTLSLLDPDSPYYFFEPQNTATRAEFEQGWKISVAMPFNCAGFITARDHFVVDFDKDALLMRIANFADTGLSDAEIRAMYFAGRGASRYPDGDSRGWKVPDARKRVAKDKEWRDRVRNCLYRPFDNRYVYWADWMVDWPRPELTRHLDIRNNKALITTRITKDAFSLFATRIPPGHKSVGAYDVNYVFPLWVASDRASVFKQDSQSHPNFSTQFIDALAEGLCLNVEGEHKLPAGLRPDDIFNYIYAVCHSPNYRSRYAEFLKIDFPRLPLPGSLELFRTLAQLGSELVALHLLESPRVEKHRSEFVGRRSTEIEKVSYADQTVWIDKKQTTGFKGVPEDVWNFHIGGYQVCHKWLKDRQAKGGKNPRPGRVLTKDDVNHYHKIVVALSETIRLMAEIDKVIEKHGGWPAAFQPKASND